MAARNSNGVRPLVFAGLGAFVAALFLFYHGVISMQPPRARPRSARITCINNLKQIGLSFKTWALDNGDQFPFNVSTNAGGTYEVCARGGDGFDSNAFRHFQVMSNEVAVPLVFLCPKDNNRKPARDFAQLRPENVTYLLRSGANVSDTHPQEVLARCPLDNNTLLCDGTVVGAREDPYPATEFLAQLQELLADNPQFCVATAGAVGMALLGWVFCRRGLRLRSNSSA